MTKLKFGGFAFPHNPKKLQIEWNKNLKVFRPPDSAVVIQNLGADYRVITGSGEFYGDDAFTQFLALSKAFQQTGKGLLTLPGLDSFYAEFHSLKLTGEAGENTIAYSFEFWEIPGTQVETTAAQESYTAADKDNLWTISAATGLSVQTLMALNPGVKNPFDLTAGTEVALS